MPNLDQILEIEAQHKKEYPMTYNAKDMLLRGHLTVDEFESISKGEAMEKYIDNNPEAAYQEVYSVSFMPACRLPGIVRGCVYERFDCAGDTR